MQKKKALPFLPASQTKESTCAISTEFSEYVLMYLQYLYIRHNNLYLLALTKRNTNAAEILLFLHKTTTVTRKAARVSRLVHRS